MMKIRWGLLFIAILVEVAAGGPREGGVGYSIIRNKVGRGGNEVGDLVAFYLDHPDKGVVVGNTALTQVGAMDFWQGTLWAASARDDSLNFYTVDLKTAEVTLKSTAERKLAGVFAGDFDPQGRFWVANLGEHRLCCYDPATGAELASVKFSSDAGYNGIAFVGSTLYAVRGGPGDPPQEFGTLDTATGKFTSIGYTNVGFDGKGGGNGCGALDYDPSSRTMYLVYRQGIERTPVAAANVPAQGDADQEKPQEAAQGDKPQGRNRQTRPQYWSLYVIDMTTGQSTFVGEMGPQATYDALAVF